MKALSYNIPFIAGKTFKLALFSDLHLDSPDCDIETLKKHLDVCKKEGRFILMGGDEFDAIIHSDKKRFTPSRGKDNRDDQINQKLEMAIELLKPYADNILFIGRGNHEESILKYSGVDMIDLLIKELNHQKKNGEIQKGNYQNFIRFNWVKSFNGPSLKTVQHYDILQNHGSGANAPVTKGAIDFNRILHGVNADLVWVGHKHSSNFLPSDPIMYIDHRGNVVMKNRQAILTPSYQKGRTINDHNVLFGERFYSHQSLPGFGSVDITPYYDGDKGLLKSEVSLRVDPVAQIGELQQIKIKEFIKKVKQNTK
jgi:hypothetical protein